MRWAGPGLGRNLIASAKCFDFGVAACTRPCFSTVESTTGCTKERGYGWQTPTTKPPLLLRRRAASYDECRQFEYGLDQTDWQPNEDLWRKYRGHLVRPLEVDFEVQGGQVKLEFATQPRGAKMERDRADVRTVNCLYRMTGQQSHGDWRPPVIPWHLVKRPAIDVPARTCRRFWINVDVPAQTPAGAYVATAVLSGQGLGRVEFPLRLEVLPCRLPAADDLNIEFNDRGPASIVHHGVELLAASQPGFRLRDLNFADSKAKDGNRQVYEPTLISRQFDPDKKTLVQQYAECRVECVFTPKADRRGTSGKSKTPWRRCRRRSGTPSGAGAARFFISIRACSVTGC